MKNIFLISILLFFSLMSLCAQSGKAIFDPSVLHEIHLTFEEAGFWDTLLVNYKDSSSFSGSDIKWLMATEMEIDGTKLDSIGVRLRGKSSFDDASEFKKPLKIDLNEFIRGQHYDGMKKFNLHNGSCDPSQLRDFLAYDVMRTAGVKAPRVAHAKVYINGQYWGLYSIIEQIDKTFVKHNFSNGNGNLYKNNAWSRLEWLGTEVAPYQEDMELKTNEETANWSDFLELVNVINNTPDSTFAEAIQEVLNVETFLRALSVDIALNNWDSYVDNQRNWYIYHNPDTDLFEWIPWDYNLSMGGDFYYTANPYRPVTAGCDLIAEFQYYKTANVVSFLDKSEPTAQEWFWDFGNGQTSTLQNPIINFGEAIETNVCLTVKRLEDTNLCEHTRCRKIAFDFAVSECFSDSGQVAPYLTTDPIFQIITREDDYCCESTWDAICEAKYQALLTGQDKIGELGNDYDFNMPLFTNDSAKVLVIRLLSVPAFRQRFLDLTCVLMATNLTKSRLTNLIKRQTTLIRPSIHQEPYAFFSRDYYEYDVGNGTGGGNEVNIPPLQYFLDQRIPQVFERLIEAGEGCQSAFSEIRWQDITINEFVASNIDSLGGKMDAAGAFEDWIELFNNTNQTIDLEGYFLTDDITQPLKWTFPTNTEIEAGDYLIIWADKDEEEAGIHTSFKLGKNGEQLMLSHEDGTVIDSLSFGEQISNIAMARVPNGTGDFVQQEPTFNKNNDLVSSISETLFNQTFTLFPNPATEQITINIGTSLLKEKPVISIRNVLGSILLHRKEINKSSINLSTYNYFDGIYFIDIELKEKSFTKKLIINHLN